MIKKKILVAGNVVKPSVLETGIFKHADIKVYTTSIGKDVLDMHRLERFSLIVLGLDVKDPAPEAICERIRNDKDLKIVSIIITGSDELSDRARFVRCKANMYLEKPIRADVFHARVSEMLNVAPRSSYRADVKVRVSSRPRSEIFEALSGNLSKTGMLLTTDKTLFKDETVECSLALGSIGLIHVRGKVVRMSRTENGGFQYGIRFVKVPLQDLVSLETFLNFYSKVEP